MSVLLTSLQLEQFRAFANLQLFFRTQTTVMVGPNALGKTSVLEAIALLSTGSSFRAEKVEEMIRFNQELARVVGQVGEDELEMMLTRGEVQGKKTARRLYSVNQVRRRRQDLVGKLQTVVFRPEDLRLVEGSPTRRRAFLDAPLCLTSRQYDASLRTYEQTLLRRNRLLQAVREGEQSTQTLHYWNQTLVKHGQLLTEARRKLLGSFANFEYPVSFTVEYVPSLISEERIAEYQPREIAAGHTLIGPHKDDFQVMLPFSWAGGELQPVESFGSRGQQRLAVLWLKMGEYRYLQEIAGQPPLLLLDDILSELDSQSRQQVSSLFGQGQVVVTTTEPTLAADLQQTAQDIEVIDLHTYVTAHP